MTQNLPYSEPLRMNQVGVGVTRRLEPDEAARTRIARALDLQALDRFTADVTVEPSTGGWRLSGAISAHAVQSCGLTLEPLPVEVNERFSVGLAETAPDETSEIEVLMDEDAPDVIEDGRIDLGQYAVEQLALSLDPFPRKPDAEFVQPEEPGELSPFAVLKTVRDRGDPGQG